MQNLGMYGQQREMAIIAISVLGAWFPAMGQLSDKFSEAKDFGNGESFEIREVIGQAAIQPGEASGPHPERANAWAKWTAPRNGLFALRSIGKRDDRVAMYEGSHPAYLRRVGVINYFGETLATLEAEEGHTYYLAFDALEGDEISVRMEPASFASNDQFETATDLGNTFPLKFSTKMTDIVTSDAMERAAGLERGGLWWEWQAPTTGWYLLRDGTGRSYGSEIVVGRHTESIQEFYDLSQVFRASLCRGDSCSIDRGVFTFHRGDCHALAWDSVVSFLRHGQVLERKILMY